MEPIVLDRYARRKLLAERVERQSRKPTPLRWHGLVDLLTRDMYGIGAAECDWRYALIGKARLFTWQPSMEAFAATANKRALVYLCWGIPQREGWKQRVLMRILRRAQHVLVNDATTREEVEALTGRGAALVPFFVDTDYFGFKPFAGRADFLFCNGSNDRDPHLLLALAERGFRVVWLVNEPILRAHYEGRHPLLELRSKISFAELRDLNQTCAMSILPSARDAHCAGQTTGMEAIACGAPIVISAGRTASIFSDLPSVSTVAGKDVNAWIAAIRDHASDPSVAQKTERARTLLETRCSTEYLRQRLAPFFGWESTVGTVKTTSVASGSAI